MKGRTIRALKGFLNRQFLRFIVVGGLNTAFGYGAFALLVFLGLHFSLAALFATVLGVLFNFKTYGTFVFRNPDNRLIFRFVSVYGVSYALTVISLGILKSFGLSSYVAGAIMILPMSLVTFYLNRRFVFSRGTYQGNAPAKETSS